MHVVSDLFLTGQVDLWVAQEPAIPTPAVYCEVQCLVARPIVEVENSKSAGLHASVAGDV